MKHQMWLCLVLAIAACGDSSSGSGVSSSKKLNALSSDEQDKLCTYTVSAAGGARDVDCGSGVTITIESKADCVANFSVFDATCEATVDDAEGCAEAQGRDACHVDQNACGALFACLLSF